MSSEVTAHTHADVLDHPISRWRQWSVTGIVLLFVVVSWADKSILGIVAQPVMKELGLTAAQFGFLASSFSFLFSITALLGGIIADRFALRWVLFTLAILWSLTALPVLITASFGALLVSRIALGAAEGPATPVAHAFTYTWFPNNQRGFPSAVLTSGASIAKIALGPVLALIVAGFGWRAGFATLGLIGVLWCCAWLVVGRPGPFGAGSEQAQGPLTDQEPVAVSRIPLTRVAMTGTFIGLMVAYFVQYSLVMVVLTWLPSYFSQVWGLSTVQSGSLLGLPSITGMAGVLLMGAVTDRMLRRGVTSRRARGVLGGVVVLVGGIALMLIPFSPRPAFGLVLLLIGYGFSSALQAICNPAIAEIVPAGQRGSALGLLVAIGSLGGVFAPWLTGAILDAADSAAAGYGNAFQVFGAMLVLGGALCWWLVNPERDAARLANSGYPK